MKKSELISLLQDSMKKYGDGKIFFDSETGAPYECSSLYSCGSNAVITNEKMVEVNGHPNIPK